jgi:hypothetical protein
MTVPRRKGPKRLAAAALAVGMVALAAVWLPAAGQVAVDLSPSSLDFGPVDVDSTSPPQTFTLSATGGATVTVLSVSGEFVHTGGSCQPGLVLAAGASCTIEVAFAPVTEGSQTGTLSAVVNGDISTEAGLSGQGVPAPTTTTTVPTTIAPTPTTTPATTIPATGRATTTRPTVPPPTTVGPESPTTSIAAGPTTTTTRPTTTTTSTTRPPPPGDGRPTLDIIAAGGGRRGPPGVGVTVSGSGYRSGDSHALGRVVLIASTPTAQQGAGCGTIYLVLDGRRIGSATPGGDGTLRRSGLSVPGDVRPGTHTVVSSCRSSGVPVLASAPFTVTDASLHRSAFATALPGPGLVDFSPEQVLLSGLAVVALLLLIAFPAELFNTTLEEHYDEVRGWFHLQPRRRPVGGARNAILFATFLLLSGPLWFAMQSSSRLDAATAVGALGLSIATAVFVIGSDVPTLLHVRRHDGLQAGLVALPGTLLLTLACIGLSRAVHFEPGYFYGLVGGVAVGSRMHPHTAGRLAGICAACMLALSVGCWLALGPVSEAARHASAGLGPIFAEGVLGGIFWAALDSLVIALLPLRLMLGSKVVGWQRRAWVVLYGLTLFAFVHILLRPGTGYVSDTTVSTPLVAFALFAGFAAFSFGFWGYFRFRRRPSPALAGGTDRGLEAPVGDEPHERHDHVHPQGDPPVDEGDGDGGGVDAGRDLALHVPADGRGEDGAGSLLGDDRPLEDEVGDGGGEQDAAVGGGGQGREVVLPHPAGGEREQREPKEQVEVGPEDPAVDAAGRLEHVVVVVPVDPQVDEAQHVGEEDRPEGP